MQMATVRLQMANGHEVWFRAPRQEIHRLVVMRHSNLPASRGEREHLIITEKDVPITVDLMQIRKIHIA